MKVFKPSVHITIHRAALESIFDECDRYNQDETGGRLLGTFKTGITDRLSIMVTGVIEPGPNAKRTATYFQQDGEHQEAVFRRLERQYPEIEHLGNWHTHHVNGYPTLSGGDRETYHRIVNHQNHNTDFFYALLVTEKNSARSVQRYAIKHFVLFRNQLGELEVPATKVSIVDRSVIWPVAGVNPAPVVAVPAESTPQLADQRASDKLFFSQLHPGLRPFLSKSTGGVYWRGPISLIDDSQVEVVVAEVDAGAEAAYGVAVKGKGNPVETSDAVASFAERRFSSAREAVVMLERELNREVFRTQVGERERGCK